MKKFKFKLSKVLFKLFAISWVGFFTYMVSENQKEYLAADKEYTVGIIDSYELGSKGSETVYYSYFHNKKALSGSKGVPGPRLRKGLEKFIKRKFLVEYGKGNPEKAVLLWDYPINTNVSPYAVWDTIPAFVEKVQFSKDSAETPTSNTTYIIIFLVFSTFIILMKDTTPRHAK